MTDHSEIVGKLVMVMFTFRNDSGEIIGYKQTHGRIRRANDKEGIVIYNEEDEQEFSLPPNYSALQPAKIGEYKESSSGLVVTNPDFMTLWEITNHSQEKGGGSDWKCIGPVQYPK
jgi:hypothetical protein